MLARVSRSRLVLAALVGVLSCSVLPAVAQQKVAEKAAEKPLQSNAQTLVHRGHAYSRSMQLEGRPVSLNGVGTRVKVIVPVYTAGLYTDKPVRSTQEFLSNTGAKRIQLTFLRKISSGQLGDMFVRAISENIAKSRIDPNKTLVGVGMITKAANESGGFNPGETIFMDWIPGKGTVVYVRGVPQGKPVPDIEFWRALSSIWVGEAPADWQLKDALFGVASKK